MSTLDHFLYPLPSLRRTPGAVFRWWESRRLAYNLIVGAAGSATLVLFTLITALPGHVGPPPLAGLLAGSCLYGILANACYSFGPLAELVLDRWLGEGAPRAGPVLFRQGLIFSVGLTFMPVLVAGFIWIARLMSRLL